MLYLAQHRRDFADCHAFFEQLAERHAVHLLPPLFVIWAMRAVVVRSVAPLLRLSVLGVALGALVLASRGVCTSASTSGAACRGEQVKVVRVAGPRFARWCAAALVCLVAHRCRCCAASSECARAEQRWLERARRAERCCDRGGHGGSSSEQLVGVDDDVVVRSMSCLPAK